MILKKLKALELVVDWNLWPRHEAQELDSTNIKRMIDALDAGKKLPPIIVNAKDYRIVDGFHRTKAHLKFYGDEAEIECIVKQYKNEADMFLESIETNAHHGLPLSPKDIVHAYLKARRMKIPPKVIAESIGINPDILEKLIIKRSATNPDGEKIALAYGASNFAGKQLTTKDMVAVKSSNGIMPEAYCTMLMNALNSDSFIVSEKLLGQLAELQGIIKKILK